MQVNLPDPPLHEGSAIFGNLVSRPSFRVSSIMDGSVIGARPSSPGGPASQIQPDLSETAALRAKVQRLIGTAKKKNVEQYARYMITSAKTERASPANCPLF